MKKTIAIIMGIFTLLFSASGSASAQNPETPAFKTVGVEEFEKIIADKNVVRLDVRSAEEYAEGHIEGTMNIDVLQSTFKKIATEKIDKKKTVALYCRSGKRSKTAAGMLAKNGYTVVELDGGFNAWVENEKATVK